MRNWEICENQEKYKDFVYRTNEFGVKKSCLLWGVRVVVPLKLKKSVLSQLHSCHPGASQMHLVRPLFDVQTLIEAS